ncbi:hypothetical protein [Streptomyces sp. NPDC046805]|uniref:hypothetical protein n=1 Tax=Streptomyces sp. NPDC046805 TaxID=3155134 RepID=UPI00340162F2
MSNGWDWIAEGQRIAAQARGVDVAAIKAESIVFDDQPRTTPAPPAGFVDEVHALKNEVDICRAGHCASGYEAVRLGDEVKRLNARIAQLTAAGPKTVAALHEALTHLGEGV